MVKGMCNGLLYLNDGATPVSQEVHPLRTTVKRYWPIWHPCTFFPAKFVNVHGYKLK